MKCKLERCSSWRLSFVGKPKLLRVLILFKWPPSPHYKYKESGPARLAIIWARALHRLMALGTTTFTPFVPLTLRRLLRILLSDLHLRSCLVSTKHRARTTVKLSVACIGSSVSRRGIRGFRIIYHKFYGKRC